MGRVAAASGAAEDLHDYLAILAQLKEAHAGASVVVLHACGLLSPARTGTSLPRFPFPFPQPTVVWLLLAARAGGPIAVCYCRTKESRGRKVRDG